MANHNGKSIIDIKANCNVTLFSIVEIKGSYNSTLHPVLLLIIVEYLNNHSSVMRVNKIGGKGIRMNKIGGEIGKGE